MSRFAPKWMLLLPAALAAVIALLVAARRAASPPVREPAPMAGQSHSAHPSGFRLMGEPGEGSAARALWLEQFHAAPEDDESLARLQESLLALGSERQALIAHLVQALGLPPQDPQQGRAKNLLAALGVEALPELTQALADGNTELWTQAAWLLSRLGPHAASAVPELTRGLRHDNLHMRGEAAFALSRIGEGSDETVAALIENLNLPSTHFSERLRDSFAAAENVDAESMAQNRMNDLRLQFIEALGNMPRAEAALPTLQKNAKEAPFPLNEAAQDAIRKIRDSAETPASPPAIRTAAQ